MKETIHSNVCRNIGYPLRCCGLLQTLQGSVSALPPSGPHRVRPSHFITDNPLSDSFEKNTPLLPVLGEMNQLYIRQAYFLNIFFFFFLLFFLFFFFLFFFFFFLFFFFLFFFFFSH
jgi:hypothetical protein